MRAMILMTMLAMAAWVPGAAAATATCAGLVKDAQSNERIARDGADRVAHQAVPVTATDRDYQLVKVIDAALVGRAALAACAAPEDKIAVSDVHVWQAGREAAYIGLYQLVPGEKRDFSHNKSYGQAWRGCGTASTGRDTRNGRNNVKYWR